MLAKILNPQSAITFISMIGQAILKKKVPIRQLILAGTSSSQKGKILCAGLF